MVDSQSVCRDVEVARYVELRLLQLQFRERHDALNALVGRRQDQSVDAVLHEGDGGVHLQALVKPVCARDPLPATLFVVRAQYQILRQSVLALLLQKREERSRGEVVVDIHTIVGILVSRRAAELRLPTAATEDKAVGNIQTLVTARRVVSDAVHRARLYIIQRVGVSALVVVPHRQRVVQRPAAAQIARHAHAAAAALTAVAIAAVVLVVEKSVGAGVISARHESEASAVTVVRRTRPNRIARTVLRRGAHGVAASDAEGRKSVYVELAAHGVSPEKGALRAAQHLDRRHVEHVEIVIVLVQIGHAVDAHAYHGLVDARAEAADVYRRGHLRAVIGLIEVRHDSREILYRQYAFALQLLAAQLRHRNGNMLLVDVRLGHVGRDDDGLYAALLALAVAVRGIRAVGTLGRITVMADAAREDEQC